jgi:hypothetical protein
MPIAEDIGLLHCRMRRERNFRPSHQMFSPVHSQRARLTLGCIRHSACRNTLALQKKPVSTVDQAKGL